jgi:ubiquinone/menaquinone biosynthesis C-methylase UbiE
MNTDDYIRSHEETATEYDVQAEAYNWRGPEVIFGLSYEFIEPGDTLLDIGIGTGLGSFPFHRAGVQVYGVDGSDQMLNVCQSKNFAVELKKHDITNLPLPFPNDFFNHVICIGVFHFFKDLKPIFEDVARLLKKDGIFGFTVNHQKAEQTQEHIVDWDGSSHESHGEKTVVIYRHSTDYITELCDRCGFTQLKELEFVATKLPDEMIGKAYVVRKV